MKINVLIILLAGFMVTSCASIIHGPKQDINVSSSPAGASIYLNDEIVGKTPRVINLKRKSEIQKVRLELDGYQPYEILLERKTDGWIWGNILFGGIIGVIVDASNGSMYKLTPKEITGNLSAGTGSVDEKDGVLYLTIEMEVDPTKYEKIGELTTNLP